ncbi:MAG: hypothetical protein HQL81_11280 [Magnetococcales bacterium]|nr:hypothetical protein [Magnetococcales bacterium]
MNKKPFKNNRKKIIPILLCAITFISSTTWTTRNALAIWPLDNIFNVLVPTQEIKEPIKDCSHLSGAEKDSCEEERTSPSSEPTYGNGAKGL